MSLERHIQTGLAVILIGFVGWVGVTVSQNSNLTARLDERMMSMQREIQSLRTSVKEEMKDRFTGTEARALQHAVQVNERDIEKIDHAQRKLQAEFDLYRKAGE